MSAASVKHVLDTRVGNRDFSKMTQFILTIVPSYISQIIHILHWSLHVNVKVNIGLLFQN